MIQFILSIYFFIGLLLVLIGPAKKSIIKAINDIKPTAFTILSGREEIPKYKIYLFGIIITLGFITLWPILLPGVIKDNAPVEIDEDLADEEPAGLSFLSMGGHGRLSCRDCIYTEEITSFTHGGNSCSAGFQCQSCGKLTTRSRTEPFEDIYINDSEDLLDYTPKQRAKKIESMQDSIVMCESYMKEKPKNEWLSTWEPTVREYKKKLSFIPEKELEAIKKKRAAFEKKYEASLICKCGGTLDRDQILFCPKCRSKNLEYFMEYIT